MSLFANKDHDPTVLAELAALAINGGSLSQDRANELAAIDGTTARTLYRRLKEFRETPERIDAAVSAVGDVFDADPDQLRWPLVALPEENTALQNLLEFGPSVLRFDTELVGIVYATHGLTPAYEALTALGYPLPSLSTFWRAWNRQVAPLVRDGVTNGLTNRSKFGLHLRWAAEAANVVWQLDAFNLDLEVIVKAGPGTTKRVRPLLLLLIDDHSRYCVGWTVIFRGARSEDYVALLGAAFEQKVDPETGTVLGGVPEKLIVDNEAAIVAEYMRIAVGAVPMAVRPAPAFSPTSKGKVERAGQTIQAMAITGKAGAVTRRAHRNGTHMADMPDSSLLTSEQFLSHIEAVIDAYNGSPMTELRGRTRRRAYIEGMGAPRLLDDETLATMMMPVGRGGKRQVNGDGIHLDYRRFNSPALADYVGSKKAFTVRRWHHRLDRIAVFYPDGGFCCMAVRSDLLGEEDQNAVRATRYRAEKQVARANAYAKKVADAESLERELNGEAEDSTEENGGAPADDIPVPAPADDEVAVPSRRPGRAKPSKKRPPRRRAETHGSITDAVANDDAVQAARAAMLQVYGGDAA